MRTSETDPIRVDFLPPEAVPVPGRIGLTFAPGKKDRPGGWDRSVETDVARLADHYKTSLLVSLIEDAELELLHIQDLYGVAERHGVRVRRLPIRDVDVPRSAEEVIAIVRLVLAVASAGDTVVIHCRGGLGRAGTLASCCLVALGLDADKAIGIVRGARPGAVETRGQETFVHDFAGAWRTAPPVAPSSERFVACLLGGALGDALGYPVEFMTAAGDIEHVLGVGVPERLPPHRSGPAVVSDDTQMTLFTAEGLVRAVGRFQSRGICDPPSVLQRAYHRWLATQGEGGEATQDDPAARGWLLDVRELHVRRAPGNTCLSALRKTVRAEPPTVDTPPNDSKGCGAVMRSAPIGLAARDAETAFTLARDAGVLTHGHPSGYLSAAYFSAVIHAVVRDVPLAQAMEVADELVRRERGAEEVVASVTRARQLAAKGTPNRHDIETLGGGWVGEEALAIALLCALTTPEGSPGAVAASLTRSVAHAGDSDSTGSLTGNILGAMYGLDALPAGWVRTVELRDVIERIAIDLHASTVLGLEPDVRRYPE